jgi:hypothetical protein
MKKFTCCCGNTVYFENIQCLNCNRILGFIPDIQAVSSFDRDDGSRLLSRHPECDGDVYRKCRNYEQEDVCNWMVPDNDPEEYCFSCRLTLTIPALSKPENRKLWFRLEKAKRRLMYTLLVFGLPVTGRDKDREHGLAFEFLEDNPVTAAAGQKIITGHRQGLITINLAEADPSAREEIREMMKERYRTLLGHFRHEIAHYYWDRLVKDTESCDGFRRIFGDERRDYQLSIDRHYSAGPPRDWKDTFISAYASMHPWEDWAETWSHYMHIVDTLETAHEWGFGIKGKPITHPPSTIRDRGAYASSIYIPSFSDIIEDWISLTLLMNALSRSMGMPDSYPFALSETVAEKLHFVHDVIRRAIKHNDSQKASPAG